MFADNQSTSSSRSDSNSRPEQDYKTTNGELSLERAELEIIKTEAILPEQFLNKRLVMFARDRHGDVQDFCPSMARQRSSTSS